MIGYVPELLIRFALMELRSVAVRLKTVADDMSAYSPISAQITTELADRLFGEVNARLSGRIPLDVPLPALLVHRIDLEMIGHASD